jgi:hypothetical protein
LVIAQSLLNVKESERFRGAGPEEAARMRLEIMAEKKSSSALCREAEVSVK